MPNSQENDAHNVDSLSADDVDLLKRFTTSTLYNNIQKYRKYKQDKAAFAFPLVYYLEQWGLFDGDGRSCMKNIIFENVGAYTSKLLINWTNDTTGKSGQITYPRNGNGLAYGAQNVEFFNIAKEIGLGPKDTAHITF